MPFTCSDIIKIFFAIFVPPIGVFLERGCAVDFWINILLTILGKSCRSYPQRIFHSHSPLSLHLGYIPGIIHALYIILKY